VAKGRKVNPSLTDPDGAWPAQMRITDEIVRSGQNEIKQ